jgi:cell volume regulation protein A
MARPCSPSCGACDSHCGVAVGAIGGLLAARGARFAHRLPSGLVLVASLATAALAYGIAAALGGSGFLAVYLVGLALGDARLADREPVIAFHRGLAMVAEIGMFFALALLVFPSQFGPIAVKALLLALITAVIARPVATTVATVRQRFSGPERAQHRVLRRARIGRSPGRGGSGRSGAMLGSGRGRGSARFRST